MSNIPPECRHRGSSQHCLHCWPHKLKHVCIAQHSKLRASNYTSRRNSLFAIQTRSSFNQYKKPQNNQAGSTPPFLLGLCVAQFHACQLKPTPVPRQTAVLLPGHWQAAGEGGSCHSCKDPLAFGRKAGHSHEIKRHSFLRRALTGAQHNAYFSVSTPSCSHIHTAH